MQKGRCLFCRSPEAPKCCGRCHGARYCDANCQKLDWPGAHREECGKKKPDPTAFVYETRYLNPKKGRVVDAATWSPYVPPESGYASTPLKLLCKALKVELATGCMLKQIPSSSDLDAWTRCAQLVKERGGQIVFGWTLHENDEALKAVAQSVWFDIGVTEHAAMWADGQPSFFIPDARVRQAFRDLDRGPPDAVWWK